MLMKEKLEQNILNKCVNAEFFSFKITKESEKLKFNIYNNQCQGSALVSVDMKEVSKQLPQIQEEITIDATANVNCKIINKFESAGMNQTLHYTVLKVYTDVYVGNPFRIESVKYDTAFEISQSVIIGEIPSTYGLISRYRE